MKSSFGLAGGIILAALLVIGTMAYLRSDSGNHTAGTPELQHIHGLAVDVANANRLLIATHHGLFQLENDALSRIGNVEDDLMGFTAHPTEASVFFSSGHSARGGNLGFQKSTDGGRSWQKISDGIDGPVDFHSMAVSTVNPNLVYGHYGNLQRSTDGGRTWEVTKGSVKPISLSNDPQRESVVYAATQNGVLVSEDRGDSWKSISPQLDGGAVSVFAVHPTGKYALTYSVKLGGMGKSTDAGATWRMVSENFGGEAVMFVAYAKNEPFVYVLTESNAIYKSADEGETWSKVR